MITALYKAFAQLDDPRLRRILVIGVVVALGCLGGLAALSWWALGQARGSFAQTGWLDAGLTLGAQAAALVVPVLFFSAVATFVMSFWLDDVCDVVEDRHYPGLGPARPLGWTQALVAGLRFLAVMVAVTAAAAPFYLALLVFGLGVILNYLVNGYLLGREYFELVASRRLDPGQARLMRRGNPGRVWLAGAVINLLFQVPILNLTAPVVAAAFMVHVVQGLRRP